MSTQLAYSVQTAIVWGELVQSAYSTYSADTHDKNPATPTGLPEGWQVLVNLQSDPVAGLFSEIQFIGFVVQSTHDPKQIGVVFRGTEGLLDWLEDFEALHVDFTDVPNGGRTEKGFTRMFRSLNVIKPGETDTVPLEDYLRTLDGTAQLTVTGHSLGGGIANLTGLWIASELPEVSLELYTFAAPMTGNSAFAETFNSKVLDSYRIYNKPDLVPKVPEPLMGYEQVNTGIELNSLDYPNLPRSIAGYHSLDTYLYMLRQQV